MSNPHNIVELSSISKHYGTVVGVDYVDLDVRQGEFLTLLGPSGCGKSTLLRMIGGFETPTTGTIKIAGEDVTRLPPQQRDVNMMFQDYALFPHMTVGANIAYGLNRKGIRGAAAAARAVEALKLVGLPETIDRFPSQLSGGQRQRVALARSIVREPKVILLDEPLSALDAKMRENMQVELKHMQERLGITFVMVTHDQTEALVMSDRIVVMERGRIAQDGTPADLYEAPSSPYVANFIGTTNFIAGELTALQGDSGHLNVAGQRLAATGLRSGLAIGQVRVGVRPEKALIVPAGDARPNLLGGVVVETIYAGLSLRTVVKLDGGPDFLVDEMLPIGVRHSRHARVGEMVAIAIEPSNIFVFSQDD